MKGFTLIELLLVIAIVLILGTGSAVFYSRFLLQSSVSNTSDQIASQFRKAQTYATSGRQNTSWGVKFESNKIILFATGNSAFDESFSVNPNLSVSGFSTVTFAKGTGLPSVTPTITISGNNSSEQVSVNSQGGVSR